MARVPSIRSTDSVPAGPLAWLKDWLESLRTWVRMRDPLEPTVGDALDKFTTRGDLVAWSVVTRSAGGAFNGSGGAYVPDLTPPPTPTGLAVSAGITNLFISLDAPTYTVGHGHALTNIYGAVWAPGDTEPTFSDPRTKLIDTIAGPGTFHAYATNPATRWAIWLKFQSVDGVESTSPAGGTFGAQATTGQDVAALLEILTGQITASQLFSTLGARINLIDGATGLAGSVNERIQTLNTTLTAAITVPAYSAVRAYPAGELVVYLGNLYRSIVATTGNLPTDTSKWKLIGAYSSLGPSVALLFTDYLTSTETGAAISSATTGLVSTTALTTALGAYTTTATLLTDYYTRAGTDTAISTATTGLVSTTGLTTALSSYVTTATLTANYYTATTTNTAISTATTGLVSTTALTTALGSYTTTAALSANYYTKTDADTAIATSTGTVSARLNNFGGSGATVETQYGAQASSITGLQGQYTVKIDLNGYVSGFGLASTVPVNGAPFSEFIIRADQFAIAPVNTDNTANDGSPFFYRTAATTINGVSVPAGAYMKSALIHDASITNAKIADATIDDAKIATLSAAKLTVGDGTVGGDLKSTSFISGSAGWRIRPSGAAEFNNVTVRGAVFASSGTFAGSLSAATGTFAGSLSAASGTFTGSLSGASITGATGTFTGSLSGASITGATGTFSGTLRVGASPAISGTTMTGTGAVINADGSLALGKPTKNITITAAGEGYLNGTWVTETNIAFSALSVSISPSAVASTSTSGGSVAHGTVTATASNGTGPYTFAWSVTTQYNDPSGTVGYAYVTGTSGTGGATCGLGTDMQTDNSTIRAEFQVVVTDANGRTATASLTFSCLRGTAP